MDTTIFDAVALAGVAMFVLSLIKPFVEQLPFAKVESPTHDATLRLLNVLLNIGLAEVAALAAGQLTGSTWLPLLLQGLAQAAGAQTLYHTATRSGGSVGGAVATNFTVAPLLEHTFSAFSAAPASDTTLSAAQVEAIAEAPDTAPPQAGA